MGEMQNTGAVPTWDLPDRLGKALRVAGVSRQDMADYLGVHRNTIGNYLTGHTAADKRTLRLWAMLCGVPLEWLVTGADPGPEGGMPTDRSTCEYVDASPFLTCDDTDPGSAIYLFPLAVKACA